MTLREKQSLHVKLFGLLIQFATANGFELTWGDAARMDRKGHMDGSLHYSRLAVDVNLFIQGKWIEDGSHPAWKQLGEFWEKLHPLCAWGGRFQDANHFSITHGGKK
jgi:hypothetical protein